MRIVFLGSGAFGRPTLQHLAEHHELLAVVSQPDRPAGRGGRTTPTPIASWIDDHRPDVPLLKPENINEPASLDAVRMHDADAWVVIAYGQKLSRELLDGVCAFNLHASLLPRWRGAAPINAAVMAGDTQTGNSVITLAERMDAGLILGQSHRPILPDQTAGELHDLLAEDGPALVEQVLQAQAAGRLGVRDQDEALVTLAKKLSRADAWVDFSQPAAACRARIHGLTPWPGVTISLAGKPIKLHRVKDESASHEQESGRLVDPAGGLISCGSASALRLLRVQPAGGRPMDWAEYVRGHPIDAGALAESGR